MQEDYVHYIDIDKAIIDKAPKLYKKLPKCALALLKKIAHQKDLNDDLNDIVHNNKHGIDFFSYFLQIKGITTEIVNSEALPKEGKYIFAANHALGGLDGIAMVSAIGKYYPNIRFVVNDLLMHLPNTAPVFVPVNKHGANSREYIQTIENVFADDSNQVLYYPAGLVSRKQKGKIEDLKWQKTFITKAIQYKRDIIPVYFDGQNSNFFYNLALWRKRLGIKANIEMLFLVDEVYKKRNAKFTITIGEKIPYTQFDSSKKHDEWADYVRSKVYQLSDKNKR